MIGSPWFRRPLLTLASLVTFISVIQAQTPSLTPDVPAKYTAPTSSYDYVKRDEMIADARWSETAHRHCDPPRSQERTHHPDPHAV